MAKGKMWYEVYGTGQYDGSALLAKVKSKGLAYIVAKELSNHYKDVKIDDKKFS